MKPEKIFILTLFTLLSMVGVPTTAQSISDESAGNTVYTPISNSVMIVDVQLKSNVLTIRNITIKPGRYNERRQNSRQIPSPEQLTKPQLFLLDSSQEIIFKTEFDFPKAITIPPPPPGTYDPYTASVIPIEEPEVSIVVPHFREASFVEIVHPGNSLQKTIKQIDQTEDRKNGSSLMPVPSPAEEGKFHVLIMGSDYDGSNMSGFTTVANSIRDFILSKEPFLSFGSNVKIHIYSNTADLGCYSGCNGIDRLICCNPSKVISAAASSGLLYDEIIVVHNTATYGGGGYRESGTAYKTNSYSTFAVTYAGYWHQGVCLHEFGHSFGNLCDEYLYSTEGYSYTQCVNCRPSCADWSPIIDNCQFGCDAKSNYYRPEDSIMVSVSYPGFNEVSIKATYFPDGLEERLLYFAYPPDRVPPTPNPMTWDTPPYETGVMSISMVATPATDPTPPISYYFDFVGSPTGGLGGVDSGWQAGTSYTNFFLQANHKYGYRVKAKDRFNNQTAYSTAQYDYTLIQTPTGITFGTITPTSIQARSTNTPTGLSWGSSGLWIENMTNTTNSGWKRDNTLWTSKSLSPNTSYSFQAKARNGNGIETAYARPVSKYTRANLPGRAFFSDVTRTSILAKWTPNGNPPGTQYFCQNVTTGTNSGWITDTSWNSDNLACSISHSFRVKAKNQEGIETGWTSLGSQSTVKCIILLTPNGGEMIPSGSTYNIQWDSTPLAESFDLFYSLDSGVSWISIAKDVRNTVQSWTVPKTIGNKKACFVRVIGYNASRTKRIGSDTSDKAFTIEVVTVIKPNGGELLHAGEDATIEWRGCSDAVKFDLMVSFDNGLNWRLIDDKGTPGVIEGKGVTGTTLTTKVPSPGTGNSKTCFIKVIAYNGAGKQIGSDTSDKPFTIEVVKLTSPNGGPPPLKQNDNINITWTAYETSEPITKVQLFYTRDAGTTWNSIPGLSGTTYPPGDYSQSWTVPWAGTTPKEKCKVKVVLKDIKGVTRGSDVSDSFFTIEP